MNALTGLYCGRRARAPLCPRYRLRVNQSMRGKQRGIAELSGRRADNRKVGRAPGSNATVAWRITRNPGEIRWQ